MPLENKINISSELSLKTIKVGDASKKYYTKEEADAKFIDKEFLVNYYTKEEADQKEEYIYDYIDDGLSLKVNNSEVSIFAQDNTIVKRTTGGKVDIRVNDPQYNDEPASKNYVDNGLSTKADKTSLADYVPWSSVNQSAYGNSIVQRKEDSSVDIRVPLAPTYNNEPASKNYVDTGLAGKVNSSEVTVHAVANTIVKRKGDSKVDIRVPEPTYGDEPASKNYADTKLAKVTSSSSHNRLYLINADGSQSTTELTSSSTPGYSVPFRRQDGNIMVPLTPGQNSDAASKGYVDEQIIASKTPTTSASAGDVLTLDSNKNPTWAAAAAGGVKLYVHQIKFKLPNNPDFSSNYIFTMILSDIKKSFNSATSFNNGGTVKNIFITVPTYFNLAWTTFKILEYTQINGSAAFLAYDSVQDKIVYLDQQSLSGEYSDTVVELKK